MRIQTNKRDTDIFDEKIEILEYLPIPVFIVELNPIEGFLSGKVIKCNKAACDFIKYSETEIKRLGFRIFEKIIHPSDIYKYGLAVEHHLLPANEFSSETYKVKPKNGKKYIEIKNVSKIVQPVSTNGAIYFINTVFIIENKNDLQSSVKKSQRLSNKQNQLNSLSKRERQIANLIFAGNSDKEIAMELNLSPLTIKTHRTKIRKKLKLKNTAELIQLLLKESQKNKQ